MTILTQKTATVFGGTGFVGRYIVRALARADYTVKVATRVPERAYYLRPYGVVGQIVPFACDYNKIESIEQAVRGSDVVINCIGQLFERRKSKFKRVHVDLAQAIATASAKANVSRVIHLSVLGHNQSRYAESKQAGEQAVLRAFPAATILRPSVIFGPEDEFFNLFAGLMRWSPILPLIGGGKTRFQPVYVGDVAAATMAAVVIPVTDPRNPQGKIYELGGPEIVTFKEIYHRLFQWTGRKRCLVPMPFGLMKLKATFLQFIPPRPLITPDQVTSLQSDNVVTNGSAGLADLGVMPTGMNLIVPSYLERFRPGGRFFNKPSME